MLEASRQKLRELIFKPSKAVEASTRSNGNIVLSADHFVGETEAMQKASPEEGLDVHKALKPIADEVRQQAFEYLLRQSPKGNGHVVFTAGGPGSGKSTFAADQESEFIFDSMMSVLEEGRTRIQQVLESRRTVEVLFIVRDPAEAMRAGLARALDEKRVASADRMAEVHAQVRDCIKRLVKHFAGDDRVFFNVYENRTGEEPRSITIDEVGNLNLEETKKATNGVVEAIASGNDPEWPHGPLPPRILAAARGHQL